MSGNGNGIKNLAQQMFATGERSAAWVFRLLFGALSVTLVIIGWFAVDKLGVFDKKFDAIDKTREATWATIGQLTKAQTDSNIVLTQLGTSLTDYIKNQERIIAQLANQEADHEQRIRQLERPPPPH